MSGESFSAWELSRIEWQFFVTLTSWKSVERDDFHVKRSFAFVRLAAEYCETWFRDVLFAIRTEPGDVGGRTHAHLLMGGLPVSFVTDGHAQRLALIWMSRNGWVIRKKGEQKIPVMGFAKVQLVFEDAGCVEYVLKRGGQSYEESKFSRCGRLVVSDSVWRKLGVNPCPVG